MFIHYIVKRHLTFIILSLYVGLLPSLSSAESANVLVSIKPLHSLISYITEGTNPTSLLLSQQQSAHHFQLRPSQKRLINKADIFFYSSDNIESFVPALKKTSKHLRFVALSELPGINTLPLRSFHSHNTQHNLAQDNHDEENIDGHIWLSIENAKIIALRVTVILSMMSPEHTLRYRENLNKLIIKLEQLKQENNQTLKGIKNKHFLVYHDALQYFEVENNLDNAHFITTNPEHSPGIKRIRLLRKLIKEKNIQCIFYEPPNVPALLKTLTEEQSIKLTALDPAGLKILKGKAHYFQLLRQTASTLKECLNK